MSPSTTLPQRYRRGCGVAGLKKSVGGRRTRRGKTIGTTKIDGVTVPIDHNGAYPLAGWEIEGALHDVVPVLPSTEPLPRHPGVYVYNTRPSGATTPTTPGHWVAVRVPRDVDDPKEFFDSAGRSPSAYPGLLEGECEKKMVYNPLPLQEQGTFACGHYVTAYCAFRLVGWTMEDFLSLFNPFEPRVNDTIAVHLATPMVERVRRKCKSPPVYDV